MTSEPALSRDDERLLAELRVAVEGAPSKPTQIEVGIALSITLGRLRPAVACGGCSTPLEFEGIPAQTNSRLPVPFRLRYDPVVPEAATPGT
ncbi:MAG: hypothetical protein L3J92_01830 [Thermoplasmata archaeon]|jgi:hypothetical protein|nr:hypothetical protein [Thermoplasmata archaeon]